VHVPYHLTWAHERADFDVTVSDRTRTIESIDELPAVIKEIVRIGASRERRAENLG
jgi:hypothetical protein